MVYKNACTSLGGTFTKCKVHMYAARDSIFLTIKPNLKSPNYLYAFMYTLEDIVYIFIRALLFPDFRDAGCDCLKCL